MLNAVISWMTSPWGAGTIAVIGLILLIQGIRITMRARGVPTGGDDHMSRWLLHMRGFRFWIVGLCLMASAVGWLYDVEALVVPAFVIGLEELYEATMVVTIIRWSEEKKDLKAKRLPGLSGMVRSYHG